ncbi:MAG TPA: DUF5050 domain-containing protein [Actinobacteria bacterium]|nr:DUF5050 domain-containing protein [Actinomycetota bacterium]
MRTTAIIITILFVLALSLLLVFAFNFLSPSGRTINDGKEIITTTRTTSGTDGNTATSGQTTAAGPEKEDMSIEKIEVYLDGTKEAGGIFLGEAEYGLASPETESMYGGEFSKSGFELSWDSTGYVFEPGTTHSFYVYAYITGSGWEYARETITVPGERLQSSNIKFFIDTPANGSIVEQETNIGGWAVNASVPDSPGISAIELYLNGPKGFGKKVGNASLGAAREDVAASTGNPAYLNSGFNFLLPANIFEPGTDNSLYCYAVSANGESYENILELKSAGSRKDQTAVISVDNNITSEIVQGFVKIRGWAVLKKSFQENIVAGTEEKQYSIKKIVFTSARTGNEDIFSMNIDGSELTQLTDNPSNDMYPQINPDGTKILYTSDINGTWQIMSMNTDGSEKKQLTNGRYRSGFPTMTFEGKYIFYEVYIDNNWELFRMNSDGTNQIRLTFSPGIDDWHPFAHPFEFKIIYESGSIGNEDIYFMNYNGSDISRVSDFQIRKRVPGISKDGKYIVFAGYEQNFSSIFIMNSDGSGLKKLTDNPAYNVQPCISPDNQFIAFYSDITGNDEIYIMNLDGSDIRKLTDIPGDDWGPVFLYQE